jgi:D-arabinose 1-dehydrogenase-like Zn-dependent alcohol dehydrogenase
MKAAVVEEPGRLVIRDIPEPEPGPYEARCELLYGSVCTGTDRHVVSGDFPFPVPYPVVLGHESVGRITDVGARVRHLQPGDLVTRVGTPPAGGVGAAWGGFAEIGIARDHQAMREDGLPEQEWRPYRIHQVVPASIDPAGAPMIITWRETLSYLTRAGAGPGDHLLIIGSGGNGVAFAAHAANLGAGAVEMIGAARRADVARRAGATAYHDHTRPDLGARLEAGHPDGFDIVVDAIGRHGTADLGLAHVKHRGTFGIYGLDDWGTLTIAPDRAPGTFTYYNGGYDEAEVHHEVIQSVQAGLLDPWLWLPSGTPLTLADLPQAFRPEGDVRSLKALVRLSDHAPPPVPPQSGLAKEVTSTVISRPPGRD